MGKDDKVSTGKKQSVLIVGSVRQGNPKKARKGLALSEDAISVYSKSTLLRSFSDGMFCPSPYTTECVSATRTTLIQPFMMHLERVAGTS